MTHTSHPAKTRRQSARPHPAPREELQGVLARGTPLDLFLKSISGRSSNSRTLAGLLDLLAKGAIQVAEVASLGSIAGELGVNVGTVNQDGDMQKQLDLVAHGAFVSALRKAPIAAILSEESPDPIALDPSAPFAVAIDPLDGSSNIDVNVSIGTIFSVYPALADVANPADHFLRPGQEQVASGFIIYGPQTSLVFTIGDGAHVFTFDRRAGEFRLAIRRLAIPEDSTEYAVNAANYRHWDDSIRAYIDDCMQGEDGPLSRDHNMRWIASLVADAYRILLRGGVFIYPGDQRRGYSQGRLRLIYEANPIAFLVEQAGGGATDTVQRILDVRPKELHARTPMVFGSFAAVRRISRYHTDPQFSAQRAPLFFQRGLIRR